jgi:2-polyprenyl-6-methoxyphenol hydroxylase-like FAD-dependent oxidoreductase
MRSERVIIIGGGVGGLAAAIALRQAGFKKVEVYERATSLEQPPGAALILWANAMKALDRLGLGWAIRDRGHVIKQDIGVRSLDGNWLAQLSAGGLEKRYGAPAVMVRRADLIDCLLETLGSERVRTDTQLDTFQDDGREIHADFADGWRTNAEVLIGADGLASQVRQQLHGRSRPRYAGYTYWRGIAPPSADKGVYWSGEILGAGARFGVFPMGPDLGVYWYATLKVRSGVSDSPAGRQADALSVVRGFPHPAEELVQATDPQSIVRQDVGDIKPLKSWGQGRATLLGDAAHACAPNLGQGACQALEDAVALADCLKASDNIAAGLRQYEERRRARGTMIIKKSRFYGRAAHWSNPLLRSMRDRTLKNLSANAMLEQMDALMGYSA